MSTSQPVAKKTENSDKAESQHQPLIREYSMNSSSRFVPRQLTRPKSKPIAKHCLVKHERTVAQSFSASAVREDNVNGSLKRKALELGEEMGPQLPDEEEQARKSRRVAEPSVNQSVLEIRKKVMQVWKFFVTIRPIKTHQFL